MNINYNDMKYIPGYEELYSIDKTGKIYSWSHDRYITAKLLGCKNLRIRLSKHGVKKGYDVVQLLINTFIGEDKELDHYKDNDHNNISIDNLVIKQRVIPRRIVVPELNKKIDHLEMVISGLQRTIRTKEDNLTELRTEIALLKRANQSQERSIQIFRLKQ